MFTSLIGFSYRNFIKPIFFKFDPELVHDRTSRLGRILGAVLPLRWLTKVLLNYNHESLAQEMFGIKFANPVGLSAGFDKNAKLIKILPAVGFGFYEIGTVTDQPYAGNPKPRLYRLPKSKALVVYYGLMNEGVRKIVARIKAYGRYEGALAVSVGKTNSEATKTEAAGIEDYYNCFKYIVEQNVGDFYDINISCPNTFGGEPFTTSAKLERLLTKLDTIKTVKPVFIKMPIDLNIAEFDKLLKVIITHNVQGVIIGNLTKDKAANTIKDLIPLHVKGGISGKPTWELSNRLISYTYQNYGERLKIIGVGGIFSAADAYYKIKLGASLVQLITGMIYEGPQLIGEINRGFAKLLRQDGFKNIYEAIGTIKYENISNI
jgi:dihydroorotate dehydrogenase